ncbi:MAG: hypothetical protein RLZZ15_1262 [Verrucomicrobiota bacterium]|jgi:hypothetical protein
MKFLFHRAPRRPLRSILLELHATGVLQVFRRHSFLRLWEPLRETARPESDFAN